MSLMERTGEQHIRSPPHWVLCTAMWAGHGKKKVVLLPLLVLHLDCLDLKMSSVHITCLIFLPDRHSSFRHLQRPRIDWDQLRVPIFATLLQQGYTRVGQTGARSPTELRNYV